MMESSIKELKDTYNNDRIFVIGNGPSLNKTPLHRLSSEYTLAMNKINFIYEDVDWTPYFYYSALGPTYDTGGQVKENIEMDTICLLSSGWKKHYGNANNAYFFDIWSIHQNKLFENLDINKIHNMPVDYLQEFWSSNAANFVYQYHSMYSAIQIVDYLGFDEIYFVGCDLGMPYLNPHMVFKSALDPYRFQGKKGEYVLESIKDLTPLRSLVNAVVMKFIISTDSRFLGYLFQQAFNETYFETKYADLSIFDGELKGTEYRRSHAVIKRICENKNINVYNATVGGELDIYDRVELNNIL